MRRGDTNKIFAVACARHRASLIVRISASADYRRVANSPGQLIRCPAGRSRRGQIAVLIQGDSTDRAVSVLIGVDKALPVAAGAILFVTLHFLQGIPAFLGEDIFLLIEFYPM